MASYDAAKQGGVLAKGPAVTHTPAPRQHPLPADTKTNIHNKDHFGTEDLRPTASPIDQAQGPQPAKLGATSSKISGNSSIIPPSVPLEIEGAMPRQVQQCLHAFDEAWKHMVPGSVATPETFEHTVDDEGWLDIRMNCTWAPTQDPSCTSFLLHQHLYVSPDAKTVRLYVNAAEVHPSHQRRGLCAALIGDQADLLKKHFGSSQEICCNLFASGLEGPQIGRIFWAKLGAEFANSDAREDFIECVTEWATEYFQTSSLTDNQRTALQYVIDTLNQSIKDPTTYTAPYIILHQLETIDPAIVRDFETHLIGPNGVAWDARIHIVPAPSSDNPFAVRVEAARKQRTQTDPK